MTINVHFNDALLIPALSRGQRGERQDRERELHLHLSGDSNRWWNPNTAPRVPEDSGLAVGVCVFARPRAPVGADEVSDELRGGVGPDAQRQAAGCR